MQIISLTPNSPYCLAFEEEEFVQYPWITDLSDCFFLGILADGILVSRMAWQYDPPWGKGQKEVLGIASIETLLAYRGNGYASHLVAHIRNLNPDRPLLMEINNPFAFGFWNRYPIEFLGASRANAFLYRLPSLKAEMEAKATEKAETEQQSGQRT